MFGRKAKKEVELTEPELKEAKENRLKEEFSKQAMQVATRYTIDSHDVEQAYKDKPNSLRMIFNNMREAKSERNSYIGWTVFWGIVLWPVGLWTGYRAFENHQKLQQVGAQVRYEVDRYRLEDRRPEIKALPAPKPPPKLT